MVTIWDLDVLLSIMGIISVVQLVGVVVSTEVVFVVSNQKLTTLYFQLMQARMKLLLRAEMIIILRIFASSVICDSRLGMNWKLTTKKWHAVVLLHHICSVSEKNTMITKNGWNKLKSPTKFLPSCTFKVCIRLLTSSISCNG